MSLVEFYLDKKKEEGSVPDFMFNPQSTLRLEPDVVVSIVLRALQMNLTQVRERNQSPRFVKSRRIMCGYLSILTSLRQDDIADIVNLSRSNVSLEVQKFLNTKHSIQSRDPVIQEFQSDCRRIETMIDKYTFEKISNDLEKKYHYKAVDVSAQGAPPEEVFVPHQVKNASVISIGDNKKMSIRHTVEDNSDEHMITMEFIKADCRQKVKLPVHEFMALMEESLKLMNQQCYIDYLQSKSYQIKTKACSRQMEIESTIMDLTI